MSQYHYNFIYAIDCSIFKFLLDLQTLIPVINKIPFLNDMKSLCRFFIAVVCFLIWNLPNNALAQVRLPQLIGNGMVLQRDANITIWGWASPGEKVTVKFTGKSYKAVTGAGGKWKIVLPPSKSGGPYTMEIIASNHIIINDIVFGDVWFCSGQSNMVIPMERVKEKYPDDIAAANYPMIRNFFIPTVSDVGKEHDDLPPGKWLTASPENVKGFGAATYFFARQLFEKYHVPIGIINSSVGGTPIQAWTSTEGLEHNQDYKYRLSQFKDTAYLNQLTKPIAKSGSENKTVKELDKGLTGPKTWYDTSYVLKDWHPYWLPGYWADQGIKNLNGVVWFRKEISLPAGAYNEPVKLFMGRIVDADFVYVNGILCGSTSYQYPPRRYTIPAGVLKPGKNIIVVRVINTAGKGGFVPEKPYNLKLGDKTIDLRGDWQYKVGQAFTPPAPGSMTAPFSAQNEPTGLYNTMVAPAINYNIKGILWYQGEANTNRPEEYRELLPELIADWRHKWHNENLPFLYVQLPNFMETQYLPSESKWAVLRETQLKTLSVPNTGMAVSIDAGEWNDIHPLDKKDIGERLALLAQKIVYGDAQVVASGPIYQSAKIDGNKIIISFTNTGSGLVAKGGELQQFAIAGKDKKYVWADAKIVGNQVVVSSDEVPNPQYVRYAWADNPDGANLYNQEGLPASPFTTDDQ